MGKRKGGKRDNRRLVSKILREGQRRKKEEEGVTKKGKQERRRRGYNERGRGKEASG